MTLFGISKILFPTAHLLGAPRGRDPIEPEFIEPEFIEPEFIESEERR